MELGGTMGGGFPHTREWKKAHLFLTLTPLVSSEIAFVRSRQMNAILRIGTLIPANIADKPAIHTGDRVRWMSFKSCKGLNAKEKQTFIPSGTMFAKGRASHRQRPMANHPIIFHQLSPATPSIRQPDSTIREIGRPAPTSFESHAKTQLGESDVSIGPLLTGLTMMALMCRHRR